MEEEWNQTSLNLQAAREQIDDLNLQVTISSTGKKKIMITTSRRKSLFQ